MAYIRAYKDGFRVEVERAGVRKSATFPTKRLAQEWARRTESGLLEKGEEPEISKTFGEAVQKYIAEVSSKKEGIKSETLRLNAMLRHFGDVQLLSIGQAKIGEWRDARLATVSASSVLRERNTLHNLFSIARHEWRWITLDPFDGVKMPKENDHRTALWDWKRIRRVLRFLGYEPGKPPVTQYQQVALAFMIGLHTSLRASEILRVNKDTFNATTRVIRVKTKTMKMAQIPVPRRAVKVLKLADFTINAVMLDALFRKARDGTLAGDLTFHDGRAFALTMLARKVDILTLARISQHKNLSMLQRYYRETTEHIANRI